LYMLKSWPNQVKMVKSLRHSLIYVEKQSRGMYRSSRVQHGTYTYSNCHDTACTRHLHVSALCVFRPALTRVGVRRVKHCTVTVFHADG
jgi:hypothetical protein